MRKNLIKFLTPLFPDRLRVVLRKLHAQKLVSLFIDKSQGELLFQYNWVKIFSKNKAKVEDYWYNYFQLNAIKRICKITAKSKILDVGCGISSVLHFIPGEKYGIDPLANDYRKIYRYPQDMRISEGNGEEIQFPNSFFDVVFCTNVLDHTDNPPKAVSEIRRVLKKNGYLVLVVHIFPNSIKRDPAHPHTFTLQSVTRLIRGFRVVNKRIVPALGFYDYIMGNKPTTECEELLLILKRK